MADNVPHSMLKSYLDPTARIGLQAASVSPRNPRNRLYVPCVVPGGAWELPTHVMDAVKS